ncbi:MAG: hypothetical protein FD126_2080 [Elusimicrobia bacterium]|nr:MAG: hypothetical protein FD126_2080 [Elusimicrobiota bacterium]
MTVPPPSKNRRGKLFIEPVFQKRFLARMAGWTAVSTLVTGGILYVLLAQSDQRSAGEFFYVVQEAGTHPELLSRSQIVLPALGLSLAVNLLLTLVFSLVYSQRLAGPIHRFKTDIEKLEKGEPLKAAFHLRDADEFKDLAHSFDGLLKRLAEKGFLKEP